MTTTVNAQGVDAPSLEEAREETDEQLQRIFGEDTALDPQTPLGQISGLFALGKAEFGEAAVSAGNAMSVDHAVGTQLDALGSNVGVKRVLAQRSSVTATLTGVTGTNVPAGSRAKTSPDNDEFRTVEDVSLEASGVTTEMQAVETGPVEATIGTLTEIVTVVPGWETVTNTEAAVVGRERQGDPEYRRTYRARTARNATGPLSALVSAIDEALGKKRRVIENRLATAQVVQEWTVPRIMCWRLWSQASTLISSEPSKHTAAWDAER